MPCPNLLFILTDQQSASALSCVGTPGLQTPNLDQLAARGVRFERAYCAAPICVPSRTSLFYGRMPSAVLKPGTENIMNSDPALYGVREEFASEQLGLHLQRAGYECVYAGKWHVGRWGPTESLPDGPHPHGFRKLAPIRDAEVAAACREFLAAPRDRAQPLFLVASFDNPHNIHEWSTAQTLPQGNLPEPPARALLPPLPSNFAPATEEPALVRGWRAQHDAQLAYNDDDWRRYRWAYFRLVEQVDRQIGEILTALDANGLTDSTLVVFTSDHGDMQGAHRLPFKSVFYDESVRVPLIVAGPGFAVPGAVVDFPVCNGLDLYPTFCAAADAPLPDGLLGHSLLPLATGAARALPREFVVSEYVRQGRRGRLVATPGWHYSVWEEGPCPEQLFDLARDPGEMVNLAGVAAHAATLQRHRELLRQWLESGGETFAGGHYVWPESRVVLPGDSYPL